MLKSKKAKKWSKQEVEMLYEQLQRQYEEKSYQIKLSDSEFTAHLAHCDLGIHCCQICSRNSRRQEVKHVPKMKKAHERFCTICLRSIRAQQYHEHQAQHRKIINYKEKKKIKNTYVLHSQGAEEKKVQKQKKNIPKKDFRIRKSVNIILVQNHPKDEEKEEEDCLICHTEMNKETEVKILKCTHMFHKKCIEDWFKRSPLCPYCRCDNS